MNNAGINTVGTSWDGLENWKKVFDVNLFGFVFTKYVCGMLYADRINCVCSCPVSVVNVQQTFVPVGLIKKLVYSLPLNYFFLQSMLHQENQAMIINTGSKRGITNFPCVCRCVCTVHELIVCMQ